MLLAQNLPLVIVLVAFAVVLAAVLYRNAALWFQAKTTGVPLSLLDIVGMRFRKVNPRVVVRTLIAARQAGVQLSCEEVERAYLEGVDLDKVTLALIRAKQEGLETSFQELVEADLEGRR